MVNSVGLMGAIRVGKLFRDFDGIRAVSEISFEVYGSNTVGFHSPNRAATVPTAAARASGDRSAACVYAHRSK